MRAWLATVLLAACGGESPRPAAPPPARPLRAYDPAVAEPWTPPARPEPVPAPGVPLNRRALIVDGDAPPPRPVVTVRRGPLAEPVQLEQRRSDLWDPCVRDLVASREPAVRDALGDALTVYDTTCSWSELRATFAPPRHRTYTAGPHIAFAGTVTATALQLDLVVSPHVERIAFLAGATRWTSPPIDPDGHLRYTASVAAALHALLAADDAIIRIGETDVPLTDELRRDLTMFADL